MEGVLRRERWVVGACLVMMVFGAWLYLIDMARDIDGMSMSAITTLSMPTPAPWTLTDLGLLLLMWSVMMVAMMLPSAGPMAMTFLAVNQRRRTQSGQVISSWVFIVGYVAVWMAYSLVATLAQWGLHEAALISPAMTLTSPLWTSGVR